MKTKKPLLVGLIGKRFSGKSSVANLLVTKHRFCRLFFASPLKAMLKAMGIDDKYIYGNSKEIEIPWLGVTGRHLMQTLGTEWGRKCIHPDLWVTLLFVSKEYSDGAAKNIPMVVDDVRFNNEANGIRSRGGILVRVDRPWNLSPKVHTSNFNYDSHESEQLPTLEPDFVVDNSGETLEDLENKVIDLVNTLKERHGNE